MRHYDANDQAASLAELASHPVVSMRRSTAVGCLAVLLLLSAWSGLAGWYFLRKDDLAARLISRETVRQYAYEDRIASLRSEIDRLSSRALLDQDSVEARVSELTTRQSQLESRHAVVASLAETLQAVGGTSSLVRHPPARLPVPTGEAAGGPKNPQALTGLAAPASAKPMPSPEQIPLRGSDRKTLGWQPADEPETREQKIGGSMSSLAQAIDQTQARQVKVVTDMQDALVRLSSRYRAVVSETSLDPERLAPAGPLPKAQGGPLIPLAMDPKAGAFEAAVFQLRPALTQFARLKNIVDSLPIWRPMPATEGDMTSNFGYRIDPFTRSPAMHSGIDFRAEHGSAVRSAGAGKVVTAEYSGGYGNMVEIDHGNDITTRYGHLSALLVSEGQTVQTGTVIGRVGSTGRSTGPHLHYETRIGVEAVDPHRFIRAGQKFGQ